MRNIDKAIANGQCLSHALHRYALKPRRQRDSGGQIVGRMYPLCGRTISLYVKIRHQLDCKFKSPFRDQRRVRTSVCTARAQQHFWIGARTCDLQMSDHPWTGCTEGSGTRDLLWQNADSNFPRSGAGFRSDDGIEPE